MRRWLASLLVASLALLLACEANSPDGRPEQLCFARCQKDLSSRCSEDQCVRGCRFILDRLVEHEGPRVVACMSRGDGAKNASACDDDAWAGCAAKVGVHADGGPPAPPPASDDWE